MKIIRPQRYIEEYASIIGLPHHEPFSRPRMDMADRAAQFAPYAALVGYGDIVVEMSRLTDREKEPGEDEKNALDARLRLLQENPGRYPLVRIRYFVPDGKKEGGSYQDKTGTVRRIDPAGGRIIFSDKTEISISRIGDISLPGDSDEI